jgi:hypothetical protein
MERMKQLMDSTVAVVGLGLMGASLGGALRGKCARVIGVARRADVVETALARGFVDRGRPTVWGVREAEGRAFDPVRVIVQHWPKSRRTCAPPRCDGLRQHENRIVAGWSACRASTAWRAPDVRQATSASKWPKSRCTQGRRFISRRWRAPRQDARAGRRLGPRPVGAKPLVLEADRQDYSSHGHHLRTCWPARSSPRRTHHFQRPGGVENRRGRFPRHLARGRSDVQMMLES